MSEPVAPAAWYPDPSSTGVLRWWDGHVWTEHTHLSNPEPVAAVAAASPVSAVPSALTADAYGIRVSLDGQTFTVKATNFAAQGALGAQSRSIQVREITALDLIAPTMLRNGTLAVVTAAGKTLVRYRRKHASGVTAVYNALTGAAVGAATGETARRLVRSSYLQRGRGHSVEEVANQRWSRRGARARGGGPPKRFAPEKEAPAGRLGPSPRHARPRPGTCPHRASNCRHTYVAGRCCRAIEGWVGPAGRLSHGCRHHTSRRHAVRWPAPSGREWRRDRPRAHQPEAARRADLK